MLDSLLSLLTLTLLEIVLGIDNVIFIAIVAGKLPRNKQLRARSIGLTLALIIRIGLLFSLVTLMGSVQPLFSVSGFDVSVKDLIMFSGGIFLLYKTGEEIIGKLKGKQEKELHVKTVSINGAIMQIVIIDIVFSFDSILTAVGLSNKIIIMSIAVILAMIVMLLFSGIVSDFVNRHPTVKMLALAFLLVISLMLLLESFHIHVDKGYIYFSMAFSLFVEMLNMKVRKHHL